MRAPRPRGAGVALMHAGFVLCAAALLLFGLGYGFETGDQLQYLLLPYREIYPRFLPGDWFTWQTSHYHVTYSWLIRLLHGAAGEELFPFAMLATHLGVLALLGHAVLRLARALGFGPFEAAFAVVVLALIREDGLAGATVNHGTLIPADLALPPFLLACAAFAEARALRAGLWLGVAGFFHANFAVLGPLVLGPLQLERALRGRRPWPLVAFALAFGLLAAPTLVSAFGSFLAPDRAPAALAITLFMRSPHHYAWSALPPLDFAWLAVIASVGLPAWRSVDPEPRATRARLLLALLAVAGIAPLGTALQSLALTRLFAFRMSVPLIVVLLLVAAAALRGAWTSARLPQRFWVVACVLLLASFAKAPLERDDADGDSGLSAAHFGGRPIALLPRQRGIFEKTRRHMTPTARFVVPPGLIKFRMLSRRAVYVDWKCAPMRGDEALEWSRRMLAVMGSNRFPAQGYALAKAADRLYAARKLEDLAELARRENMSHLVAYKTQGKGAKGLRRLFSAGPFNVFAVLRGGR